MTDRDPGFGIYVHWPFCAAKCPYCDFNSHVSRTVDHAAWREALVKDLKRQVARSDRASVTSIFFGGGTPSLMEGKTVGAVIDTIAAELPVKSDCEITLEANPTSVDAVRFHDYRAAGVNRLSLGVQALNDVDLKALGRLHSADEARQAIQLARQTFPRMSFDLIYARQNQGASDWAAELGEAIDLAADHLSLYQLTIEANTRFGELQALGKLRGLPSDALASDLYEITNEVCKSQAIDLYEISNYARDDAQCRHNLTYWRYGPYLGVGPGAHGRVLQDGGRIATAAETMPSRWLSSALTGDGEIERTHVLSRDEQGLEYGMMSLRLREGLSRHRLKMLSGWDFADEDLRDLSRENLISFDADTVCATDAGRLVLNHLCQALFDDLISDAA